MPYYNVFFRYVDSGGKLRHDHTLRVPAGSKEEAKKIVLRGERAKKVVVDKIVKI